MGTPDRRGRRGKGTSKGGELLGKRESTGRSESRGCGQRAPTLTPPPTTATSARVLLGSFLPQPQRRRSPVTQAAPQPRPLTLRRELQELGEQLGEDHRGGTEERREDAVQHRHDVVGVRQRLRPAPQRRLPRALPRLKGRGVAATQRGGRRRSGQESTLWSVALWANTKRGHGGSVLTAP